MNLTQRFAQQDIMSLTSHSVRFDLAESVGPDLMVKDVLKILDISDLQSLSLGYGTAQGGHRLRCAIAKRHHVNPDQVVVTVGGMHALFLTSLILCTDQAHVLVAQPVFPLTAGAVSLQGARVEEVSTDFSQGYRLTLNDLLQRLRPDTRLVCLASPQNPSGVAVPHKQITELLNAMADRCPDAFVLVDETYREAVLGDDKVQSSVVSMSDRLICCASLSKCHGAPGLRIGWLVCRDAAFIEQCVRAKFQSVIACSSLDEALATAVLEQSDDLMLQRSSHLQNGRECVANWVAANDAYVEWVAPNAGALCCVRLRTAAFSKVAVEHFYRELGQRDVRVASGTWFGESNRVFRLGFGLLPIVQLRQGLEVISDVLKNTCDKKHVS